jgi:hypothetical protein
MNEYQLRDLKTYEESVRRLRLIVDELNELDLGDVTEFEIQPIPEDYDFTPRFICISALIMEGPVEIICERDGYGNAGRWEFRASGWPTYINQDGSSCTVDPSNLYQPRANRPTTTAAQDREPKAIAKQIASKIIPDYINVYKRCLNDAQEREEHSNSTADALRRLTEACGQTYDQKAAHKNTIYTKGNGVESFRVEFRSEGDVIMHLTTEQAIKALEVIR